MKRWQTVILGVGFSGVFLWIALSGLDWGGVGAVLGSTRWGYVLLAMLIWSFGLAARAVRWRILLGERVSVIPAFHILNIGFAINNTLPLRIGELARAYLMGSSEEAVSGWSTLMSIVTERILDMLTVVLLLVAVIPTLAIDAAATTSGLLVGAAALAGFIGLMILAHRRAWATVILAFVTRLLPFLTRLESPVNRLLDGLQPLTTRRGLLGALLWTGISWFVSLAGSWVLALAFPSLPQTAVMRAALTLSVVAASFSIIIPFTLASVGPFEAATRFALLTAAVPQEVSIAYALVWHSGVVLVYAIWGAVGMVALGLSFGQIQAGAASFSQPPVDPIEPSS